jgi:RNA polymerase sigma factor (sigma-70 family)
MAFQEFGPAVGAAGTEEVVDDFEKSLHLGYSAKPDQNQDEDEVEPGVDDTIRSGPHRASRKPKVQLPSDTDLVARYRPITLTPEEEAANVRRWQTTRDEEAHELLVRSLVLRCAAGVKKFRHRLPTEHFEDLFQEALAGAAKAIDKFEFGRGARLGTYAHYWAQDAVKKYLRRRVPTVQFREYLDDDGVLVSPFNNWSLDLNRVTFDDNGRPRRMGCRLSRYSETTQVKFKNGSVRRVEHQMATVPGRETLASWLGRHPEWDFRLSVHPWFLRATVSINVNVRALARAELDALVAAFTAGGGKITPTGVRPSTPALASGGDAAKIDPQFSATGAEAEADLADELAQVLDPRKREIVQRNALHGETFSKIGESLLISGERARQLYHEAVGEMRARAKDGKRRGKYLSPRDVAEIRRGCPETAEVIADVEVNLKRTGHLRWKETRPGGGRSPIGLHRWRWRVRDFYKSLDRVTAAPAGEEVDLSEIAPLRKEFKRLSSSDVPIFWGWIARSVTSLSLLKHAAAAWQAELRRANQARVKRMENACPIHLRARCKSPPSLPTNNGWYQAGRPSYAAIAAAYHQRTGNGRAQLERAAA